LGGANACTNKKARREFKDRVLKAYKEARESKRGLWGQHG